MAEVTRISGSNGSDIFSRMLEGTEGEDYLSALDGNDWLDGAAGSDTLDGGSGFDMARYDFDPGGVLVNLMTGEATDGSGSIDTLISIEAVYGSPFDDHVTGDGKDNDLLGDFGDDSLFGGAGIDDFWPGRGNDRIFGGNGARDRVWYEDAVEGIKLNLATGLVSDGDDTDFLRGVEDVVGSRHDDLMVGSSRANIFLGQAGDDVLRGEGGRDTLNGGSGNDTILGGAGRDTFFLSTGEDIYRGGAGADHLIITDLDLAGGTDVVINLQTNTLSLDRGEQTESSRLYSIERITLEIEQGATLIGSGKRNRLEGGDGRDTLDGGGARDWLSGGEGDDQLMGGAGADTFSFTGNFGRDTIVDFDVTQKGEVIVLTARGEVPNFTAFKNASRQEGRDVVYDAYRDEQNILVLKDVTLDDLLPEHFDFG